jgi:hypothetical protein
MKNKDLLEQRKNEIFKNMNEAAAKGDNEKFFEYWKEASDLIQEAVLDAASEDLAAISASADRAVLAERGVRQLTAEETKYYEKVIGALRSANPKEAVANLDIAMPETVLDAVFDELQTRHPLLEKISFTPTTGLTKMLLNDNPLEAAKWGKLCDEIIKELTSGLREVDMSLLKLSAFVFVCKAMLDLGPIWLDSYIRQMLYEALKNGLEMGIVAGSGKDEPIGMIKQVGDDVIVSGGVYPDKTPIKITAFDMQQVGNIVSQIAVDGSGKPRMVEDLILLVNPIDYFGKVLPATRMLRPDGAYADVFPVPADIIQSIAVPQGKAIFGIGYKYFMGLGTSKDGQIDYSDHYRFIEDDRTYIIKLYGNGFPMDNNAFVLLDISEVQPFRYKVEVVTPEAGEDDATLAALQIGNLTLSPTFAPEIVTYTAGTTNATNMIKVTPAKASAEVLIKVGDTVIQNGGAATWVDGANTVTIDVTDGEATKKYTVTVTKS